MGLFGKLFGSKETMDTQESAKVPPKRVQLPGDWEAATVKKWFGNFGFLARGEDAPDIFVHKSTLQRCCRVESLIEGQRVDVKWQKAQKGLEATDIRLRK